MNTTFSAYINLLFPETEGLSSLFRRHEIKEMELLLRIGDFSDCIYYLEEGIVREFAKNVSGENMEESTFWILGSGNWFFSIESFVSKIPSRYALQALSPCICYAISKEEFLNLKNSSGSGLIDLYENYLLKLEKRNRLLRIKNAEARLELYEKEYPELANKVKLKYLASFLNITNSELSRIRSRRRRND